MGKRLVKVSQNSILNNKNKLTGKEADLILTNKSALHGIVQSLDSEIVMVDDKKGKVHKVLLVNIEEILYDHHAPY